jgi:hypothetical protein
MCCHAETSEGVTDDRPFGNGKKEKAMNRKLSIATVSGCNLVHNSADKGIHASLLASTAQTMTNNGLFGLIVVCFAFVLFALAGYGLAELSMID